MKLIECHIENFGKLRDYTVKFDDGCNIFCRPNGWGKSTLAVFLRVMFFGFEGENRRKEMENERKRYQPWQGGVYGGSLIFETGGKYYRATRVFGMKKQEDVFELRDADTNLESRDFTENLGEEIFSINSESFQRTIFISQNDCVTHSTDSINAKIGNLTDNMEDLDCFEKAAGLLQEELNRLNPGRKTGQIYRLNNEITRMQTQIAAGESLEESLERLKGMIRREKDLLEAQAEEKKSLEVLGENVSRAKDLEGKQMVYRQICEDYAVRKAAAEEVQKRFPGGAPDEKKLRSWRDACAGMEQAAQGMQVSRLTGEELSKLERWERMYDREMTENREDTYEEQIRREMEEVSDLIRCMNEAGNRENVRGMKMAALETLKAAQSEKTSEKRKFLVLVCAGVILAVLGAAAGIADVFPGSVLIAAGILLAALGIFAGGRKKGRKNKKGPDLSAERIRVMEEEIRKDDRFIREAAQRIKTYLSSRGESFSDASYRLQDILRELMSRERDASERRRQYGELKARQETYEKFCRSYAGEQKKVLDGLQELLLVPSENLREQMEEILSDCMELKYRLEHLKEAEKKKREFEAGNDMERIRSVPSGTELPEMEELNRRVRRSDESAEEIRNRLHGYEEQLAKLQESYDSWTENKKLLETEQEQLCALKEKYRYIQKAREHLGKAKENLTVRYMEPLMNSFLKYYKLILGREADQYYMDANTNITVLEQGMQRDTRYLSTGYQDLIGVCMRLALADAMYQGEKPFLVLDDPFVNLDDEKAQGGRRLLAAAAEKYQIIYFTCSESSVRCFGDTRSCCEQSEP